MAPPPDNCMILPRLARLKCGRTARHSKTEPRRLISIARIHSCQSSVSIGAAGTCNCGIVDENVQAAELRERPSTSAVTSKGPETSAGSASTDWPAPVEILELRCRLFQQLLVARADHQACAGFQIRLAISNPRPTLAPVMMAYSILE